jgi:hypothetical protein
MLAKLLDSSPNTVYIIALPIEMPFPVCAAEDFLSSLAALLKQYLRSLVYVISKSPKWMSPPLSSLTNWFVHSASVVTLPNSG